MGSWPFIAALISLMILWAVVNTGVLDDRSWDPYPYILLNLGLSMLAGLQGAILLIAAKRQDGISAAMALHDFETDVSAKQGIDHLIELGERQLAIILELQEHHRTGACSTGGIGQDEPVLRAEPVPGTEPVSGTEPPAP